MDSTDLDKKSEEKEIDKCSHKAYIAIEHCICIIKNDVMLRTETSFLLVYMLRSTE